VRTDGRVVCVLGTVRIVLAGYFGGKAGTQDYEHRRRGVDINREYAKASANLFTSSPQNNVFGLVITQPSWWKKEIGVQLLAPVVNN